MSVILMLLLLMQTVGFTSIGYIDARTIKTGYEAHHARMHAEGTAHHHDHDGSVSVDDTSRSIDHIVSDSVAHLTAVFYAPDFPSLNLVPAAPNDSVEVARPPPDLDGPRRPPRRAT